MKKPDGSRAIGTKLAPTGEAIASIRAGEANDGQVDILGTPYITPDELIMEGGTPISIMNQTNERSVAHVVSTSGDLQSVARQLHETAGRFTL